MAERRKTIKNKPKTIQQITNENTEPYIKERGKPPYPETNRANEVTMRGEEFNDLTVGIEDINEAVMFYFKEVIRPYVIEDAAKVNVPVIYSSPERFKASQIDGILRDKEGKMLMPVITLTRTNIEKVRTIGNKLDGNKVNNYAVYEKRYSKKNHYDAFSVLTNRIPVKEFLAVAIPDYYKIRYDCAIYVNFIQDMDRIIEAIGQYSYSYWGKEGKFKFMAAIDSFDSRTEIDTGSDRVIICNFSLVLNGYITPKDINKNMATTSKFLSKAQIIFTSEIDGNIETADIKIKQNIPSNQANFNIFPERVIVSGGSGGTGTVDPNILTYLNTNKAVTATSYTSNTATFTATFLTAPTGLPTTSVANFIFYINGQYIEHTAITSFVEAGSTCVLTIDSAQLGYLFTDLSVVEIVAIGKFA